MKKMQKTLLALLALPLLFTSCLSSSNSEPDPLAPGIDIYNAAATKNQLALLPADVAFRLAMILAEAESQGLTGNDVFSVKTAKGAIVRDLLFPNSVRITQESETKFKIMMPEGSTYWWGTVYVETHGDFLLEGSTDQSWDITAEGLNLIVWTGVNNVTYLYNDDLMVSVMPINPGNFDIAVRNVRLTSGSNIEMLAGWNGNYALAVGTTGPLTFTEVSEKNVEFTFASGSGRDSNISWDGQKVTYKGATNVESGQIVNILTSAMMIRARLLNNTDPENYPSSEVSVSIANNGTSYTVTYNGMTATYGGK